MKTISYLLAPLAAFAHDGAATTSTEMLSILPLQEIVMVGGILVAIAIVVWNWKGLPIA